MIICKYCVPLRILGKINIIKTSLIEKINNNFGTNLCNIPGSFLLFFQFRGKKFNSESFLNETICVVRQYLFAIKGYHWITYFIQCFLTWNEYKHLTFDEFFLEWFLKNCLFCVFLWDIGIHVKHQNFGENS